MEAANAGHIDVVSFLVNHKADVNLTSKHGVPALVYAATANQIEVVEYLVARGADTKPIGFIKKEIQFDFPAVQRAIERGLDLKNGGMCSFHSLV